MRRYIHIIALLLYLSISVCDRCLKDLITNARLSMGSNFAGAAPPPPPAEPQMHTAAQSQPMAHSPPHRSITVGQSAASGAAVDVSQDEVLQEWSASPDELKRQWAAWYISNPSEWIEYKLQYATKQTQQQSQQGGAPSASPTQPQVMHASPDGSSVHQHSHSQAPASQPQQHVPQQQSPQGQAPQERQYQQQSLQPQIWQQPQQQYKQSPYHHASGDAPSQHWPPSGLAQAPASISASAPGPAPKQNLSKPPWEPTATQAFPPRSQHMPPAQPSASHQTAHHGAGRTTESTITPHIDPASPWHGAPQPSAPASYAQPGRNAGAGPLAPPSHSLSHAAGPWSAPPAPRDQHIAPMLAQAPPHTNRQRGAAPRPMAQLEQPPGERPPAPAAPPLHGAPRNSGPLAVAPTEPQGHVSSDVDRIAGGRSDERQRQSDRPEGFVRGGRHKPPPSGIRGRSSSGGPVPGLAWRPQQEPLQAPARTSVGFAADPIAATRPPSEMTAGMQPNQPPAGAAMAQLPPGQPSAQQWPSHAARPQQPPPSGPRGVQPPWIQGAAPRGPSGPPPGATSAPPPPGLQAPAPPQAPAAPGAWQPHPSNGGPPALGPWQAPHLGAGDTANGRGAGPPQGPPAAAPAPLGPPRPLPGGKSMAPSGVMNAMDSLPPAMQPMRPQWRGPPGQVGAGPRPPMLPPPQSRANSAGPPPDSGRADVGAGPRGEYDMPANRPAGSPTPRPGPMYGMHSPQGKGIGSVQPRPDRPSGMHLPRQGASQNMRYGSDMGQGDMRQLAGAPPGPRGPGPYQGRPMLGDGARGPDGPGAPEHGFRPPGFMPAVHQVPGPPFPGRPPARPQREMLNGPQGPVGGPYMPGRPGMIQGQPLRPGMPPYQPQFPHARP